MVGLLTRPVLEAGAETVWHRSNPKLEQQAAHHTVMERLPASMGEHQRTGSPLQCVGLLENLQGASAQRHPVLAVGLHPLGGDGPHPTAAIDLRPFGPPYLAPPGCPTVSTTSKARRHSGTRCTRWAASRGAYLRNDLFARRREVMQEWGDYLGR